MEKIKFANYVLIGYLITLWLSNWNVKLTTLCVLIALPIQIYVFKDELFGRKDD